MANDPRVLHGSVYVLGREVFSSEIWATFGGIYVLGRAKGRRIIGITD